MRGIVALYYEEPTIGIKILLKSKAFRFKKMIHSLEKENLVLIFGEKLL